MFKVFIAGLGEEACTQTPLGSSQGVVKDVSRMQDSLDRAKWVYLESTDQTDTAEIPKGEHLVFLWDIFYMGCFRLSTSAFYRLVGSEEGKQLWGTKAFRSSWLQLIILARKVSNSQTFEMGT